ncbi:MAG: hypothetical protein QGF12_00025 [SAR202 cluster bacterium]|nr:hypothetical protein [SAR202 cluster bacterium]
MRLILMGIEYAGKHTLGVEISRWWAQQTGGEFKEPPDFAFHDHFTVPHVVHAMGHEDHRDLTEKQVLGMNPGLMEHYQRYQIFNKLTPGYIEMPDLFLLDWYYSDAVYAPLYYGYGGPGQYADRRRMARGLDRDVLSLMPDMVLVLMKASPDAIVTRIESGESPFPRRHTDTLFKARDAEVVLERFDEQYEESLIVRKFVIDTTVLTVEDSLLQFKANIVQYLTSEDRLRVLSHKAMLDQS